MGKKERILLILFFLTLPMFVVRPVYSTYGTIEKVVISAPSSASAGQAIRTHATVYTRRSG